MAEHGASGRGRKRGIRQFCGMADGDESCSEGASLMAGWEASSSKDGSVAPALEPNSSLLLRCRNVVEA